jgi:hypothetical protein
MIIRFTHRSAPFTKFVAFTQNKLLANRGELCILEGVALSMSHLIHERKASFPKKPSDLDAARKALCAI